MTAEKSGSKRKLEEREKDFTQYKKTWIGEMKREKENYEMRSCTFKPKTNRSKSRGRGFKKFLQEQ